MRPRYFNKVKTLKKNEFAVLTNKSFNSHSFSFPYFLWGFFDLKNLYKRSSSKIPSKFCAFIVSNPSNLERLDLFKKLSKYKKVDSFGRIFKNSEIPKNIKKKKLFYIEENAEIYKDYKFVICFENSYADEYITEKLPNAMLGGAIPIYKGAPNVGEYFNTNSFINYDDYGSFDKMIDKVIELDKDDKKYKKFLKEPWFTKENLKKIKQKKKDLRTFLEKIF